MIADAQIRLATPADAPAIAAMSRDYIESGLPWGWRRERVARAIFDPDTNVAVAGAAGAITGFGIMRYADDEAHLQLFAVRPEHRQRGVGSALLSWLEAVSRVAGAQRIRVECREDNLAARNFYCVNGYHELRIHHAMYGGRVDGVRLEKWLRTHD